jgi:hypothetical protein
MTLWCSEPLSLDGL